MERILDKSTPIMRAAIAGLSLMLTACVPWPHYEQRVPPIYGVVAQNGQPVVGAEVSVTFTEGLNSPDSETKSGITDVQGKFRIDGIGESHLFAFIAIGDRFYTTDVAIKYAGKEYAGFDIPGSLGENPVRFECNLGSPIPRLKRDQFCRPHFSNSKKD